MAVEIILPEYEAKDKINSLFDMGLDGIFPEMQLGRLFVSPRWDKKVPRLPSNSGCLRNFKL